MLSSISCIYVADIMLDQYNLSGTFDAERDGLIR